MTEMTDDLLARIRERAADPLRRYMMASEDQSRVELPTDEIQRRFDERDQAEIEAGREPGLGHGDLFRMMQDKMREWGHNPDKMSFIERADGTMGASTNPPGATPLSQPPSEQDWEELERLTGRSIPHDLRRLYSIADGGFGPGFTGLKPVESIGASRKDLLRRGPDYCGTIAYPDSFLPIAEEMLHYHYDLDTGRIISSDQDWENHGLEPEDVYDIAFQSLAAMMEHWRDLPPNIERAQSGPERP
jgi:hypothetical protein